MGHSCQKDQGEVTGEARTQAAHQHTVGSGQNPRGAGMTRLSMVVPHQCTILHEVYQINAYSIYVPKGNASILTILEAVFSQTWLSS